MSPTEEGGKIMTNNMKPVYLIGGSRRGPHGQPDTTFQAALRECGKPSPSVGYVGTASDDDTRFLSFMMKEMQGAGAGRISHALITPHHANLKKAQDVLAVADIVFISGGDVERGMEVLREKGMVDFLFQLYRQGKPFFGVSAGSIMLAKEWIRWRDPDDDATAEIFPCLGMAPIICDTHAEEDDWQELKALLALEQDNVKGYGIPSGAAIKVFPDGKVEALAGAVSQYIRRGGRVERLPDILPALA
jgi:peptidase E